MKPSLLKASISLAAAIGLASTPSVRAASFSEQEVNQNQFAVIAAPYRHGYNLVVVEQIPGQQKCWSETGTLPTKIDPLFLDFDFTNACKRSSDSNNYSIRFNGRDFGMDYLTNVVEQDGELHLVGIPRDKAKPQLHIGRTHGLDSGSLKIVLDPQWRITKRTYEKNATEHIYLSNTNPSNMLVSHAAPSVTPTQQTENYSVSPATISEGANSYNQMVQPVNYSDRQPVPNNYFQPVYQQPVYSVPVAPQQPMPQPANPYVYQQPVYPVPVAPQQPIYFVPANNGYGQQ